MRIHKLLATVALGALFAVPAHAQSIQKIGAEVHHDLKTAGNDIKGAAKDAGSAAHHTLKTAGNDTKATLGNATGVHTVGGDVGKIAHKVSHTGKKYGAKAKHSVKHTASQAHDSLTKAGNQAKADVKKPE